MPEIDFGIYPMYAGNGTLNAVLNDLTYDLFLTQTNVHIPAVHPIDGTRYAMELHVNFYPRAIDPNLQEFMLTLLFQEGSRSEFIDSLLMEV